jgi:hypothetical protein
MCGCTPTEAEDIRYLVNEKYSFQEGDEELVILSLAGGCSEFLVIQVTAVTKGSPGRESPFCYHRVTD